MQIKLFGKMFLSHFHLKICIPFNHFHTLLDDKKDYFLMMTIYYDGDDDDDLCNQRK